jgi:hypothetical protein
VGKLLPTTLALTLAGFAAGGYPKLERLSNGLRQLFRINRQASMCGQSVLEISMMGHVLMRGSERICTHCVSGIVRRAACLRLYLLTMGGETSVVLHTSSLTAEIRSSERRRSGAASSGERMYLPWPLHGELSAIARR